MQFRTVAILSKVSKVGEIDPFKIREIVDGSRFDFFASHAGRLSRSESLLSMLRESVFDVFSMFLRNVAFMQKKLAQKHDIGTVILMQSTSLDFQQEKKLGPEMLKEALEKEGLTAAWAARNLKCSHAHVSKIFAGKYAPSLEVAMKMKALAEKINRFAFKG